MRFPLFRFAAVFFLIVSSALAQPKVLHFGNGAEPEDLDPQTATGVPENKLLTALFEGLVAFGPNGSDTVGGVAERWETSDDGLVYTFYLRANARWSNGDPVTAHDFVASYERILTPSLAAEYANHLYAVVGAEEFNRGTLKDFTKTGFKALDEHRLQLTLKNRTSYLLEMMKHYSWFPVHVTTIKKFGDLTRKGSAWTRVGNIVGNGPFVLKEWTPDQRIVVTKSPSYWDRDQIRLDEIVFYPVNSLDTEERMFRTGQLNKTQELPVSKIDVYKKNYPTKYRQDPYYGLYFLRLNVTKAPLTDKRVRKALALAFDRESLLRNVTRGGEVPAYNYCPPSDKFVSRSKLTGGVEEAKKLLAEAGYPGGKNFPPVEILYNTQDNHRKIAEAIQEMWRRNLGIEVGIQNQEWKVYLDSQDTLNYTICRGGWIGDYPDPNTFMDLWATNGGNNDTGFSNAEYDRLLQTSFTAADDAARMEIYQQMEAILIEELPFVPVYFYTRVFAVDPNLNWVPNVLDNANWKYVYFKK